MNFSKSKQKQTKVKVCENDLTEKNVKKIVASNKGTLCLKSWPIANAGSAMSLSYGVETMEAEEKGQHYLYLFFDVNRGGFYDVANKILNFLDYRSLIMFKRTCKLFHEFNAQSDIEKVGSKFRFCVKSRSGLGSILLDSF